MEQGDGGVTSPSHALPVLQEEDIPVEHDGSDVSGALSSADEDVVFTAGEAPPLPQMKKRKTEEGKKATSTAVRAPWWTSEEHEYLFKRMKEAKVDGNRPSPELRAILSDMHEHLHELDANEPGRVPKRNVMHQRQPHEVKILLQNTKGTHCHDCHARQVMWTQWNLRPVGARGPKPTEPNPSETKMARAFELLLDYERSMAANEKVIEAEEKERGKDVGEEEDRPTITSPTTAIPTPTTTATPVPATRRRKSTIRAKRQDDLWDLWEMQRPFFATMNTQLAAILEENRKFHAKLLDMLERRMAPQ